MTDARLPADGRDSLSVFVDHAKALKLGTGGGGWPGRVVKLIEQKGESVKREPLDKAPGTVRKPQGNR
eukprot:1049992-Prymnesium_polylepis.1